MIPFLGSLPYLDGNIDFVKTYDFYSGGFNKLFSNWGSVHPPLKEILSLVFFKLFGLNSFSYTLIGFLLGQVGIYYFYLLIKNILGEQVALVASILLSLNPLYLSVGLFSLTDFLLSILIIVSLYYYSFKKLYLYAFFASLGYLAKETGILLILSVIVIELLRKVVKKSASNWSKLIAIFLPLITPLVWGYFLSHNGKGVWSDWNFSSTSANGTVYTIIHNLWSLEFLNKYAFQNWLQLFLLNFNWVHWLILLSGTLYLIIRKNMLKKLLSNNLASISFLFCFSYIICVLSFQTYTIPRYALPIIPFLLAVSSFFINYARSNTPSSKPLFIILVLIMMLSLFYSVDPISKKIWGEVQVMDETLYGLNKHLSGNDGITYNIQYMSIVKKRSELLRWENKISNVDCYWLSPDPRNEQVTNRLLIPSLNQSICK